MRELLGHENSCSLLFIYLARNCHLWGWLPCGTITICFPSPFVGFHALFWGIKSKRRHLCSSCLRAGQRLSFGLWCGSGGHAQDVGVRGSFAFGSQGSRVCLLQESEKALLVQLFFFPLEQFEGETLLPHRDGCGCAGRELGPRNSSPERSHGRWGHQGRGDL